MGTGYTRNDTSNNIADGNIINAADLDGEFDAIESALGTSGHTHDGTSAEGGPVTVLGPVQDFVASATEIKPKTTNTLSIGTSSLLFKDMFLDGVATIGSIKIDNAGTIGSASDGDAIAISSGGVVTFSQAPVVDVTNSTTNAVTDVLDIQVQSTGTPAVGIGSGFTFGVETAAGNVETGGAIRSITTGLTPTAEEIDLVFYSMRNGSLTEGFRYDSSADNFSVTGSVSGTGTSVFASLDISGDIDVDGTTNLDVVDIDGAVDMASTLQVDGAITSSSGATITTADNTAQLTLRSTDTDANVGPVLDLNRNVSGADDDNLGSITFTAKDDAGNAQTFAKIDTSIRDASNSTEASRLNFHVASNGSETKFLGFIGQTASSGAEITFNEDSNDIDFRVESNGNANMLFVDGGNNRVGIGTSSVTAGFVLEGVGDARFGDVAGDDAVEIGWSGGGSYAFVQAFDRGATAQRDLLLNSSLRITSTGNVGIGTDAPQGVLDLGAASTGRALTFAKYNNIFGEYSEGGLHLASNYYGSTSANSYINSSTATYGAAGINISGVGGASNSGVIEFFTDAAASKTAGAAFVPSERMRIDSSGNVGIGTATTSSAKVHISTSEGAAPTNTTSYTGALRLTSTATAGVGVGPSLMFRGQTGNNTPEYSFAAIQGVKGSATAADYSGHLVFYTQPSGGATLLEEAMRIDAIGNLLVGMTSANTNNDGAGIRADGLIHGKRADVVATFNRKTSDGTVVEIAKDNNTIGTLGSNTTGGQSLFDIASEADAASNMRFLTSSGSSLSERMRISSAGLVGIGTGSPSDILQVNHPSTAKASSIRANATNTDAYFAVGNSDLSDFILLFGGHSGNNASTVGWDDSNDLRFATYQNHTGTFGSERMRIDSSGHLLVGKTSSAFGTQGIELQSDGELIATKNGTPIYVNRITTDGAMQNFYKDGTAVGSIGVTASDNLYVSSTATDHAGLVFNNTAMGPWVNNAASDGTMDIGTSSNRFKDLYLSGGVFLGGTGSTNKLDDYEDGSWTVNLYKGGSALAVTNRYGYYRRVGDLLHISFYWLNSSITTTGTSVYTIRGMPFNLIALANAAYQFCPVGYNSLDSNNFHRWQANSSTELNIYGAGGATNVSSGLLEFSGAGVFRI